MKYLPQSPPTQHLCLKQTMAQDNSSYDDQVSLGHLAYTTERSFLHPDKSNYMTIGRKNTVSYDDTMPLHLQNCFYHSQEQSIAEV